MFHKQVVVTAKTVADHSKRSRHCGQKHFESRPWISNGLLFNAYRTYVTRGQGGRNVKLTAYLLHSYSPYMPSRRGQIHCPQH